MPHIIFTFTLGIYIYTYSLTKEEVVMGMLKRFELAKEDETAQERWKTARKQKRQVCNDSMVENEE